MRVSNLNSAWIKWWLLAWTLIATFSWADAPIGTAATPKLEAKTEAKGDAILVVGDSLSAGYGIDINQGWVTLLGRRLETQGYGYRVVNASVSGETSGGARSRLQKLLELHRPTIVFLEVGANDGLRGLPLKQTRDNLTTMVQQIKATGARVLLAGMQMPPNYGARYTQEFSATFADVAREQKQSLVPFFLDGVALDMKLIQADGLHPTAEAQPRLLENVWKELRLMLKAPKKANAQSKS